MMKRVVQLHLTFAQSYMPHAPFGVRASQVCGMPVPGPLASGPAEDTLPEPPDHLLAGDEQTVNRHTPHRPQHLGFFQKKIPAPHKSASWLPRGNT